jgi:hypothetical protein
MVFHRRAPARPRAAMVRTQQQEQPQQARRRGFPSGASNPGAVRARHRAALKAASAARRAARGRAARAAARLLKHSKAVPQAMTAETPVGAAVVV